MPSYFLLDLQLVKSQPQQKDDILAGYSQVNRRVPGVHGRDTDRIDCGNSADRTWNLGALARRRAKQAWQNGSPQLPPTTGAGPQDCTLPGEYRARGATILPDRSCSLSLLDRRAWHYSGLRLIRSNPQSRGLSLLRGTRPASSPVHRHLQWRSLRCRPAENRQKPRHAGRNIPAATH